MTLYYIILHYELASIFIQPCFTYQLDLLHSPFFVACNGLNSAVNSEAVGIISCVDFLINIRKPRKSELFKFKASSHKNTCSQEKGLFRTGSVTSQHLSIEP